MNTPAPNYRQILDDVAKALHLGEETGGYHYADLPAIVAERAATESTSSTYQTPEVQQALRQVGDVVGGALRQVLSITGHPDAPPETAAALHHLGAMEQAWDDGFEDGSTWHHSGPAGIPNDPPDNPYRKLLDDRREFIREQVDNAYGALVTDDDEFVLGDENAEWFDAVLDAHDEWLALQQRKTS
ncbi:hypothetical protein PBI_BLUEBERRY_83 [Gordonia phage Blueberry]|uniref:Uncharacterized protein n=1 Tax=Gordonia phage Azula TaxID=2762397 RepID=A0A7G8LKX3_9CAUD|nr:hypothetical protein BH771_gp83 [Gordonia phage Blueberry]YP_010110010.1 hypothetical protein KNV23_gp84 [Gordonia phage Azula]QGJ97458.1 hypothetical protein SEA_GAMBINO_86 [Gordonia phage Gambino]QZD97516.1 hypothetical protein SEA_MISSRONA_84 [Gordonia phage MissRona]ANA85545.1 hypothetical protein PBI_BLUEBERRY_83 [Gordonia phage Blueberry]QNJ57895.1 hypothetical protein SEA_AZULA_84 [Gordonia phage Azula]